MEGCAISSKPTWYVQCIKRLSRYQENQNRANILRKEIEFGGPKTTAAYSLAPAYTGPGDSVGNLAGSIGDMRQELLGLEKENALIDYAVSLLSQEKQLIISLKYLQENKDLYVQRILRKEHRIKSRDTYYRWKDEAVGELAKMLGEMKGEGN